MKIFCLSKPSFRKLALLLIAFILIFYFINFSNVYSFTSDSFEKNGEPRDILPKLDIVERKNEKSAEYNLPVLVITYNRPAVSKCIDSIFKAISFFDELSSNSIDFPIYVSQDGEDPDTLAVLRSYGNKITLKNHPLSNHPKIIRYSRGYYRLAQHYRDAIKWVFDQSDKYDAMIIIEDDLEVSQDILSYFNNTLGILKKDPSVFCISAFNDNGKLVNISETSKIYRTDFFPGLGWMFLRSFWNEVKDNWPDGFWDEYIREPNVRKERSCLRPEISRTTTFGSDGTSGGQFFSDHLKEIKKTESTVDFSKVDLNYLIGAKRYERYFMETVNATHVKKISNFNEIISTGTYTITYSSKKEFLDIANFFGIMNDFKNGIPRTAYKGIVTIYWNESRIFIVPQPWNGYDKSW